MLRVGSLQRIAKPLLRFSLHAGDDSRDAQAQLQAMLPEARGRDADLIRRATGGGCACMLRCGRVWMLLGLHLQPCCHRHSELQQRGCA